MRREPQQQSSTLEALGFVVAMFACVICFAMVLPPIIPMAIGALYIASLFFKTKPQAQCDQCHLLYDRARSRKCPKCGCYRVVK
jgi:4-hydroxybenzoate polyprenyltransferase